MKALRLLAALALLFPLLSCKKAEAPEIHSAKGRIVEMGDGGKVLVIKHDAFSDGFMEAMTMSFELREVKLAEGLKAGDLVEFSLQRVENGYPIVSIKKLENESKGGGNGAQKK